MIHTTFEAADLDERRFDIAVAATAFHWVDARRGVTKVADHLVDNGWLALWWTVFRDFSDTDAVFDTHVRSIAARFQTRERVASVSHGLDTERRIAEITADDRLRFIEHASIPFTVAHTPESLRALFASFSDWSALPQPDRDRALDDVAGFVDGLPGRVLERTYSTVLYLAQRVPSPET